MTPPPETLDNARVLFWARSEAEPFGAIHFTTGGIAHLIHGFSICRYVEGGPVYRFSCDLNWEVVQDADYPSIEEAMASATQLFGIPIDWQPLHGSRHV